MLRATASGTTFVAGVKETEGARRGAHLRSIDQRANSAFSVDACRRRKMAKRKRSSASGPRTRSKAAKDRREAEEAESTQGLDKLPQELWEKILIDHLDVNDLFPLVLSCRYFRQKVVSLVERQGEPESGALRLNLQTNLKLKRRNGQPASADYLRFCMKETVSRDIGQEEKAHCIIHLATFHGHLPLLQELLEPLKGLRPQFYATLAETASESSSFQSSLLFVCFDV